MLWHLRLGHPSFKYLKALFPIFFEGKDISSFQCEVCEFAKHHRNSFPIQAYKPSKPFSIILDDLPLNIFWCTTFVHDHKHLGIFIGYLSSQKVINVLTLVQRKCL